MAIPRHLIAIANCPERVHGISFDVPKTRIKKNNLLALLMFSTRPIIFPKLLINRFVRAVVWVVNANG